MRILFFGRIADIAGPSREIDTQGFSTVRDVTEALCKEPALADLLKAPTTVTVLDHTVVKDHAELKGAAELAYLPPVSGG